MIGIIVAMEKELRYILEGLTDVRECVYYGKSFYEGELNGITFVIALSGIGKVNAAYTATLMIEKYDPTCIINTGIAGGVGRLPYGSVLVVESAVQYDCDTTAFGDPLGTVNVNGENKVYFETDVELRTMLALGTPGSACGIVATGDRFVSDSAFCARLRDEFNASACDMECAAIAEVAYLAGVRFGAIKVVSDSADDSAGEDYMTFADRACRLNAAAIYRAIARS